MKLESHNDIHVKKEVDLCSRNCSIVVVLLFNALSFIEFYISLS